MQLTHKVGLALALLTVASLTPAVQAQTQLNLGQYGTTLSGTATLTDTGTTASGTYQYLDGGLPGLLAPGTTTYDVLVANNTSHFDMSGGYVGFLGVNDTSTASIASGVIGSLEANGTSLGSSVVNISGGNFTSHNFAVDGVVSVAARDTSSFNITGGSFQALETGEQGNITLYGKDFTETSAFFSPGYGFFSTVTGTLQDGTSLNALYYAVSPYENLGNGGTLVFKNSTGPVPEASTTVSFGLLLCLGLGGLVWSARRRKAQAGE